MKGEGRRRPVDADMTNLQWSRGADGDDDEEHEDEEEDVATAQTRQHEHAGILNLQNPADGANRLEACSGCERPIVDRYIMKVRESSWHESCLVCSVCHQHLDTSCYSRDRRIFCKSDYDRLFGAKCAACTGSIAPAELVMKALEQVYHLSCFLCCTCGRQLQRGDEYVLRSGRLYCRQDFEKEIHLLQQLRGNVEAAVVPVNGVSVTGQTLLPGTLTGPGTVPTGVTVAGGGVGAVGAPGAQRPDGRRGPKRPRTMLTTAQRRAFKASFEISQKPCRKVREALAKETGLSVRIVQVWFQNQRAKLKKIQRKQQQQQRNGGSGTVARTAQSNCGDSSESEIASSTRDSCRRSEDGRQSASPDLVGSSPYRLALHELDSAGGSPSYNIVPSTVGGLPYDSPHSMPFYAQSEQAFMKTEIGADSESSLGGLEDVLIGSAQRTTRQGCPTGGDDEAAALLARSFTGSLHGNALNTINPLNPIDRLYSMQSSYFNSAASPGEDQLRVQNA
ncbi:LIM homeobox transcription factor 1-beta-like isoform X2 [Varroa jacobsoni]|uniref:LIM homeobox transcription factor 1-beta-like isoform X2 n=1 Tax=Varroa jacobsoni TaxID=62625 RepID=UPI000BF501E9|nr:LIM homeobox transcription factor 1-beta-like isoform X2 [Varroa jacobsoni]